MPRGNQWQTATYPHGIKLYRYTWDPAQWQASVRYYNEYGEYSKTVGPFPTITRALDAAVREAQRLGKCQLPALRVSDWLVTTYPEGYTISRYQGESGTLYQVATANGCWDGYKSPGAANRRARAAIAKQDGGSQ